MNFLRSKKFQKHIHTIDEWFTFSEDSSSIFNYSSPCYIVDSIWEDVVIPEWLEKMCIGITSSEKNFITALCSKPIIDVDLLRERQQVLLYFQDKNKYILDTESDQYLQWYINSSIIDKNYLFNILFPKSWYTKWIYSNSSFFSLYQMYHCYLSPMSSCIYPISMLLGPYWFLTKKLKLQISYKQYVQILRHLFVIIKSQAGSSLQWYRFVVIMLIYSVIYVYTLSQLVDLSIQLHKLRRKMLQQVKKLHVIQNKLYDLFVHKYNHYEFWKVYEPSITKEELFFSFQPNTLFAYKLLSAPDYKKKLQSLYKVCVIHDSLIRLSQITKNGYTYPVYGNITKIGFMKNPQLPKEQVDNPISLQQNLIISGPNAGGKTTYVKSLLWNIILAQTLGIIYGKYAIIKPNDAILHHHRIKDIVGENSLFQAEMNKIQDVLEIVTKYQSVIYFLDEPLHSTHPLDGAAMLTSVLGYMSQFPNIRMVVTSHYFSIQELEDSYSGVFRNLCVKAKVEPSKVYFNYKIYKGPSKQTVGIELLEKNAFPKDIYETAIKLKNKIYSQTVNV